MAAASPSAEAGRAEAGVGSLLELVPAPGARSRRDALWEHCQNALGIARLLVREGRPAPLVATACLTAAEMACRAALEQAEFPFDGDLDRGLARLSAPVRLSEGAASGPERLAAAERVVSWLASYLRCESPERSWGY